METKAAGSTLNFAINTHKADGTPITWAGSPAVAVTKDGGTTTETDGVSLSVDAGTVVGRHIITIDTSQDATFYATGHKFSVIVTAGTVDSVSTVGLIVAEFELGEVPANVNAWNGGALPVPAVAGDEMALTSAYDAAKTAAQAGDEMDLVDAPNSTAVAVIQSGLATPGDIPDISDLALEATVEAVGGKVDDLQDLSAAEVEALLAALPLDQGSEVQTYTVRDTDNLTPLSGVRVTVTTNANGTGHIVTRWTNDAGEVVLHLDPGTYYLWRWRADRTFDDPDIEVVE